MVERPELAIFHLPLLIVASWLKTVFHSSREVVRSICGQRKFCDEIIYPYGLINTYVSSTQGIRLFVELSESSSSETQSYPIKMLNLSIHIGSWGLGLEGQILQNAIGTVTFTVSIHITSSPSLRRKWDF